MVGQDRNPMLPPPNPEQIEQVRAVVGVLVDFLPIIGDVKGGLEFFVDPSWGGAAILGISLIPGGDIVKYGDEAFDLLEDGMKLGTNDALETSLSVLGDGYSEVADGVFRSSDGRFQVRMTDSDLAGRGTNGRPHVNIERGTTVKDPRTGRAVFRRDENIHVMVED